MSVEAPDNPPLVQPRECYHDHDTDCVCNQTTCSDVTLRDLFAGMAMGGFIASHTESFPELKSCARHAYAAADALLEARSK